MPSTDADRNATTSTFVDDYLADWDDDPFRSPSPEPGAKKKDDNSKKRKEPDTLGIDEQIDLKKPRAPRVKLDEARLLSDKGIPKLRKTAPKIKLKGKGHEARFLSLFSDAARLLSFYQVWLDDLFPKATFLDALAMVEKTGHKTVIKNERMKWIDEGKPKSSIEEDDDWLGGGGPSGPREPTRVAPIFEKSGAGRATTPGNDDVDLFGDDIYGATPRASRSGPSRQAEDVPDEDDLDALMAEAEGRSGPATSTPAFGSIFGGGLAKRPLKPTNEPADEDMEALLAEAEAQRAPPKSVSLFGNGKAKPAARATGFEDDDEDDMDAIMAMADAEAQSVPAKPKAVLANGKPKPAARTTGFEDDDDDDDMDALEAMAEAEKTVAAKTASKGAPIKEHTKPAAQDDNDELEALMAEAEMEAAPKPSSNRGGPSDGNFEAEEEAMAEMEGLW